MIDRSSLIGILRRVYIMGAPLGAMLLLWRMSVLSSMLQGSTVDHGAIHNDLRSIQTKPGNRRYFVLHVGPQKTGTTSIQSAFEKEGMRKLLRSDRYKYLDTRFGNLQYKNATTGRYEFSAAFKKVMYEEFHRDGFHIVGSNEYLTHLRPHQIREWKDVFAVTANGANLTAENPTLKVVVTYRRFHGSLTSEWNQKYKRKRDKSGKLFEDSVHRDWPGINGDTKIISFADHFINNYYLQQSNRHNGYFAYYKWKDVADEIILVNFHQKTNDGEKMDIETNFICHALPEAEHTCLASRLGNATTAARNNPSNTLDYDMLAVHAYEEGLLERLGNATMTRNRVAQAIERRVKANNLVLPQVCLSRTVLEYFYQKSLEYEEWFFSIHNNSNGNIRVKDEKWLFSLLYNNRMYNNSLYSNSNGNIRNGANTNKETPSSLTPEQLSDFDKDWGKSIVEQKFCNVDVDAAIADKEWQSFFRNLKI